jgi:hypothetical protein
MKHFVDCYEKAFAERTEWERAWCALHDEDVLDDYVEEETDSTAPGTDAPPSGEAGESLTGEPVERSDQSLMKPKYEHVPGELHREPYAVLCWARCEQAHAPATYPDRAARRGFFP